MSVVVRMPDSSGTLIPAVKRQIWSLDSQIPLNQIKSMDELLDQSFAERRFNMFLLGLFAGLAMILAAVGTYGVMAYSVTQRTHEIGIRRAVGTRRRDVLRLVMRLMTGLLFGVTPMDPATFAAVVLLMMAVVFRGVLRSGAPGRAHGPHDGAVLRIAGYSHAQQFSELPLPANVSSLRGVQPAVEKDPDDVIPILEFVHFLV